MRGCPLLRTLSECNNCPSDDRANQQNSFAKTFGDLQGDGLPAQSLLGRSGLGDDGALLDMRVLSRRQIAGIGQPGSGYADFRTNSIAIEIESAAGTSGEIEARLGKVQTNEPA